MNATVTVDELMLRAADAGATYLSWTWLVEPFTPNARRLDTATLTSALVALDDALPVPRDGEDATTTMLRVLCSGALTNRDLETDLARRLTDALLPQELLRQLKDRIVDGRVIRLRLTPSPRLARVPWEILMIDDERRLIEVAEIRYDPPATVHVRRSVSPAPWESVRGRPALFVIDPLLPRNALVSQVLVNDADRFPFVERLDTLRDMELALWEDEEIVAPINGTVTRQDLSKALEVERSRLFYLGHVDSEPAQPGSAGLLLSDTVATVGGSAASLPRTDESAPEDHLPLTALDLLLGTTLGPGASTESSEGIPGHKLWRIPSRVAIIACEGGADYRAVETFGLVIAMIDSGAELVTTTRWVMPTDAAFRMAGTGMTTEVRPTTDLALEVDRAHNTDDPIAEIVQWQRRQLDRWRTSGDIASSPLVWASLTHTVASSRPGG